ncbi:MAG: hypothetical protein R2710_23470 [Acidimicrobiales bacterium]
MTITSHGPGDDTTEVEAFLLHPPASAPSVSASGGPVCCTSTAGR